MNMKIESSIDPVASLLKSFSDNRLQCVFLREENYLSLDENDLDFWCSADQKEQVVEIILEQGWFIEGGRSCQSNWGESHVLRFKKAGVHPVLELWIGDLRADALIFCSSKEIAANVIAKGDLRLLTDEFLLNILVLRPVLKRRNLLKYIERVSQLSVSEEQVSNWIAECNKKFGSKVSALCTSALNRKFGRLNRFDVFQLMLKQYSIAGIVGLLWESLTLTARKVIYRPPLISFIGTDGSGKSTTAEALLDFIKSQKINVEYVYAGRSRNNSGLVSLARSIIFKLGLAKKVTKEEWETHAVSGDKSGKKQANSFIQVIALLVYFFEYHIRYFKIKLLSRLNKQIQILDRGSWDIATLNGLGRFPVRLAKYCPQTDITFFCYAKPSVIQSRKLERSFHEIIRHQATYKYLGSCSNNVFVYMDTTRDMKTLNQLAYQYFSTMLAIHNGQLDKKTAHFFLGMPLSIWTNQSY